MTAPVTSSPELFMTLDALTDLLERSAELGVLAIRREMEPRKDLVSQRELWRRFGRRWVESRVRARKLEPVQIGPAENSPIYYSVFQATALFTAKKNARLMFLHRRQS